MLKYCCRECQKAHWSKHKRPCEDRVAELYDEKLFKEPSVRGECPICMYPHSSDGGEQIMFKPCCGQNICKGCIHAQGKEDMKSGKEWKDILTCPFCRMPEAETNHEIIRQTTQCADNGNADAINVLANMHRDGKYGIPRDSGKTNELYLKAGRLGSFDVYLSQFG